MVSESPTTITSSWWHNLTKLIFVLFVALHVILSPSIATIFVTVLYAVVALTRFVNVYYNFSKGDLIDELTTPGVMIFQSHTKRFAAFTLFFALYFAFFFAVYIKHEVDYTPSVTNWLPPAYVGKYTFSNGENNALPGSVTDSESIEMRSNEFVWPKEAVFNPPTVEGVLSRTAGPAPGTLACNADSPYICYAPRMIPAEPPKGDAYARHKWVPLTSDFYNINVRVTPAGNTRCNDLEVYRINLDPNGGIAHAMDYPSSSIIPGVDASIQKCNLFNQGDTFCLGVLHAFSAANYSTGLSNKCTAEGGGLTLNLPSRSVDVDPMTGTTGLDILLVTRDAKVETHALWVQPYDTMTLGWLFKHVVHQDIFKTWRESTDNTSVCIKFIIAISPVLICWYYLTLRFEQHVCSGGIVLLWVMILLPSTLIFASVGAWIPAVGCVACVIAINNRVYETSKHQRVPFMMRIRQLLLFLTATCNSVQFVWLTVLIAKAGYSAFLYDISLHQLYDMSYSMIISSGAPATYIAVMLPSVLALTLFFMLGGVLCLVLELLAYGRHAR